MIDNFDDENNFPHKLLLTDKQVSNLRRFNSSSISSRRRNAKKDPRLTTTLIISNKERK